LQIGAGTGLIFLLRWYWWRINAWGEIAAMAISFLVALYFQFVHVPLLGFPPLHPSLAPVAGVLITTLGWLLVTYGPHETEPWLVPKVAALTVSYGILMLLLWPHEKVSPRSTS
jgi:solute:Na+ symporter, SSS family